jgi:hypothetical protein
VSHKVKEAIEALNPSAKFVVLDDSVDKITWVESTTPIAKEDIEAKMTALASSNAMKELRFDRTVRLVESDWSRLDDVGLSESKKAEWATYRQALRDLPSSANPSLNSDGTLNNSSVTWPSKPS